MHSCENNTGENLSHLEQMVNGFLPYSQQQLGFDKPVKIVLQSDPSNADVLLGKTAHYNPETFEVYVYTDKRHPKDIMRSLSHELVHHAQNCRGDFGSCDDTGPGYAQRNPHLRKMEREAYTKGNLIFRDFEDLIKRGKITIDINFKDSGEPQMSLKEWKDNELNTLLMKKWGLLKEGAQEDADLEERYNPDEPEASDPWSIGRGGPSSKRHPRGYDSGDDDSGKATTDWERRRNKEISARQLAKRNRSEGKEELEEWAPGFEPPGETHDFLGNPLKHAPKGTKAKATRWYGGDAQADDPEVEDPEHAKRQARQAWIEKNLPPELREGKGHEGSCDEAHAGKDHDEYMAGLRGQGGGKGDDHYQFDKKEREAELEERFSFSDRRQREMDAEDAAIHDLGTSSQRRLDYERDPSAMEREPVSGEYEGQPNLGKRVRDKYEIEPEGDDWFAYDTKKHRADFAKQFKEGEVDESHVDLARRRGQLHKALSPEDYEGVLDDDDPPPPGEKVTDPRHLKRTTTKLPPVSVREGKISVREAKEITRRIIERIRKEGK